MQAINLKLAGKNTLQVFFVLFIRLASPLGMYSFLPLSHVLFATPIHRYSCFFVWNSRLH